VGSERATLVALPRALSADRVDEAGRAGVPVSSIAPLGCPASPGLLGQERRQRDGGRDRLGEGSRSRRPGARRGQRGPDSREPGRGCRGCYLKGCGCHVRASVGTPIRCLLGSRAAERAVAEMRGVSSRILQYSRRAAAPRRTDVSWPLVRPSGYRYPDHRPAPGDPSRNGGCPGSRWPQVAGLVAAKWMLVAGGTRAERVPRGCRARAWDREPGCPAAQPGPPRGTRRGQHRGTYGCRATTCALGLDEGGGRRLSPRWRPESGSPRPRARARARIGRAAGQAGRARAGAGAPRGRFPLHAAWLHAVQRKCRAAE